jgi:hypothetical protein
VKLSRRGFFGIAAGAVAGAAVAKLPPAPSGAVVTAKPGASLQMARYTWGSFHDGFGDDFRQGDLMALVRENMETLKRGFEENFDLMIYRKA